MGKNLGAPLQKSLTPVQFNLIQRVASQAAAVRMPAYIVGGLVRDLLLGGALGDFDIVVEGDAIRLGKALAKELGGKLTSHAEFGTARWFLEEPKHDIRNAKLEPHISNIKFIDLITARSESYSRPGALPTVTSSTIEDDLRRRDFTINAMAVRLDSDHFGELLDLVGGQADMARGVIRVLHARSFLDDPTRMLRAVRYAVRYAFELEDETRQLINPESRSVLSQLSGERLRREFDLIFEEEKPSPILARLAELDLLAPIHSLLSAINHQLPILNEPPSKWGEFGTAEILSVRQTLGWLCWLMPAAAEEIESVAERLAFPGALMKAARAASDLMADLLTLSEATPSQWTFYVDDLPPLAVYAVYLRTQQSALREYFVKWRHVRPHTTGDKLKARGLPPGPEYQKILSRLRAAWLDGEVAKEQQESILLEKELDRIK